MTETLKITNGTTSVTLIGTNSPFRLVGNDDGYSAGIPTRERTWNDIPSRDGRHLSSWQWKNLSESYKLFMAKQSDQDEAANQLRSLIQLLIQAISYTSPLENSRVWMERKADATTNTEYGMIIDWNLPGYEQPFSRFFRQFKMKGLTLTVELDAWSENPPGTGTASTVVVSESAPGGQAFGTVDENGTLWKAADKVFVTNHHKQANLTHIFNYDTSAGTFSSNLIAASLPLTLFPASPAVGDCVYFGIEATGDYGPFHNLIFNLSTALAATTSITAVWERYSGGWATISPSNDDTNTLQNTGINGVFWDPSNIGNAAYVNGVNAYWVRLRITSISGTVTQPVQANQVIHTASWPYVEIRADDITGDLPAKARIIYHNRSSNAVANWELSTRDFMVGRRLVSRGADFTPYLNFSDRQVPTGITIYDGTNFAYVDDITYAPTGRALRWTPPWDDADSYAMFRLDETLALQYQGVFRAFLRTRRSSSSTTFQARLLVKTVSGTTISSTEWKTLDEDAISLGQIDITTFQFAQDVARLDFRVEVKADITGDTLDLIDLALMPVDEWATFLSFDTNSTERIEARYYADIDSVSFPMHERFAVLRTAADDTRRDSFNMQQSGPVVIQPNQTQRYWFFAPYFSLGVGGMQSATAFVQIFQNQRYVSTRGDQ